MESIDWLTIKQDHKHSDFPRLSDLNLPDTQQVKGYFSFDHLTGDTLTNGVSPIKLRGSFDTSIRLAIRGSTVYVDGNVGRYDRLDNLNGFSQVEQVVDIANQILTSLHPDFPIFTPCTKIWQLQQEDDTQKIQTCSDGAIITRIDLCANSNVGRYNVDDYLRALSTLPFGRLKPKLFENGKTVDWKSCQETGRASTLTYNKLYDKAYDLYINTLKKAKRIYNPCSDEMLYLKSLYEYCREMGTVRHEIEFKSRYLQRNNLNYFGLSDYSQLNAHLKEFISLDQKAGGNAMTIETLEERLVAEGICPSYRSAATTVHYYNAWRAGRDLKASKRTFDGHRAKLRKLGIDIALKYDQSKVVDLFVKEQREIIRKPFTAPTWYRHPKGAQLRAVS